MITRLVQERPKLNYQPNISRAAARKQHGPPEIGYGCETNIVEAQFCEKLDTAADSLYTMDNCLCWLWFFNDVIWIEAVAKWVYQYSHLENYTYQRK
jgi:hypothetical protein